MVLAHPARGAAGAAGIDDAGQVAAAHSGHPLVHVGAGFRRIAFQQRRPFMHFVCTALHRRQGFHADDMAAEVGLDDRRKQRLAQLGSGDDRRAGARILQDVNVIARGVGGVGGHGNAARRHDRQVRKAPLGPVLRHDQRPVARLQTHAPQRGRHQADLARGLRPARGVPGSVLLRPEHGRIAQPVRPLEKQRYQVGGLVEVTKIHADPRPLYSCGIVRSDQRLGACRGCGKPGRIRSCPDMSGFRPYSVPTASAMEAKPSRFISASRPLQMARAMPGPS